MAQAVLSREDPRETFLKSLPSSPAPVEVLYPVGERHRRALPAAAGGRVEGGGGGTGGGGGGFLSLANPMPLLLIAAQHCCRTLLFMR